MTTVDLEHQQLLIGGQWTGASGGATFERTDPFTGRAVTVAAAAGRKDARRGGAASRRLATPFRPGRARPRANGGRCSTARRSF